MNRRSGQLGNVVAIGLLVSAACSSDDASPEGTLEEESSDSGVTADAAAFGDDAGAGSERTMDTIEMGIRGPLEVTATSHPFGAADHLRVPMDLDSMGFVEEEFILSGLANVYTWPAGSREAQVQTPDAPYATRVLVRRPADEADFSGVVVVELLNPTNLVDLEIGWALSYDYFVRTGAAWVGVTSKPVTVAALKAFDPERYAELSWANPAPSEGCTPGLDSDASTENGLIWDIFSQLGASLRNEEDAERLVGAPVDRVYGFGYSQSGGMLQTYMAAIHPLDVKAHGSPVYDGYLSATFGGVAPINQCEAALPRSDARANATDIGVPVIKVNSQTDTRTLYWARKPDADAAPEQFRLYEVAGAGHATDAEVNFGPAPDDVEKAGVTPPALVCGDHERSRFPLGLVFNAAFANLDAWVRDGTAPPPGRVISVVESEEAGARGGVVIEVDEVGNALGGVRLPHVEAPTSTWYASNPAGGSLACILSGYEVPLEADELTSLYPDHASYVAQVEAAVEQLVADRYLLPADGEALIAEAQAAPVP